MNVFDYYICPSFYEGFGLSLLEAQINHKIVFLSDHISPSIIISNNCYSFSLQEDIDLVAKRIIHTKKKRLKLDYRYELSNMISLIDFYYQNKTTKKVLFIANSDRHIKLCHLPYMKLFQQNGYSVHVATNSLEELPYCDKKINLYMKRNPYSFLNFIALFKIRKIVKEENYKVISCHTPIGGFLGRCSKIGLKNKPIVFYMAHGFHFYKGSSFLSWIIYYPVERFLSRFSDAIITMNKEDYQIASSKFHCPVYCINGVGLNPSRLEIHNKNMRSILGLENKFIVTYLAEISKRKNQFSFLKVLKKYSLPEDIVFLMIGDSSIKNVSMKIEKYPNVKYIPFVDNVGDYISISDLIISPSRQEGLPQNILEAEYFKKMVITTNIRGNSDLVSHSDGILVDSLDEMVEKILSYYHSNRRENNVDISQYYVSNVMKDIISIYNNYLENDSLNIID